VRKVIHINFNKRIRRLFNKTKKLTEIAILAREMELKIEDIAIVTREELAARAKKLLA